MKPNRIVDLGQKVQRYDLSRLPKKKRKSSSFVRRKEGEGLQAQGCVVGLSTDCEDELPTVHSKSWFLNQVKIALFQCPLGSAKSLVLYCEIITSALKIRLKMFKIICTK